MSRDRRNGANGAAGRAIDVQRYWAFLSYSHVDSDQADWLHKAIETFRVPQAMVGRLTTNGAIPKRLSPIFRDRHELAASNDLGQTIREALGNSRFLIVLCSPSAASSQWVNEEIVAFKKAHGEDRVLAAIIDGEPWASRIPGREDEECFPPALRVHVDRRGKVTTRAAEPIAADLREGRDGRQTGLLKLIAGMFGLGLDDLVQRDQQRRQRRLTYIAAASIAGMALTSGLAVFAFEKRDEARDQRREAEGLVAYMVGDLKDKLEPIGKLDALDGVGSRVLAYYRDQNPSDLTDAALLQRSKALSLTAQVAFLRGNYEGASRLYRQAMAGTGEAISRRPNDPERLFEHAQNIFWIGDLARRRGQVDEAEGAYRNYKQLADRMAAIEPDNLRWRMEVQYARENIGIVLMIRRRFADAARQFGDALGPVRSLASLKPDETEYQKEVSNLLAWLADAEAAQGNFAKAVALRRQQLSYLEPLQANGAGDITFRWQMIPAHQALGRLLTIQGQVDDGNRQFQLGVARANALMAVEPDNSLWKDLAANVQLLLARNLILDGQASDAAREVESGCRLAAALRGRGPKVAGWQRLQTLCLEARTRLALAGGATETATQLAEQTMASAKAEQSGDPLADRYSIAAAFKLLGDARRGAGDRAGAMDAWTQGLRQLPPAAMERPSETSDRAQLLKRVGRIDEARPLFARLNAIGFRSTT